VDSAFLSLFFGSKWRRMLKNSKEHISISTTFTDLKTAGLQISEATPKILAAGRSVPV
jgi:hypothetical protein